MISEFFINRPIVAMVIAIVMVILGVLALRGLPLAQFPQISWPWPGNNGPSTMKDFEREHILDALHESGWVIGGPLGAAARLGMNRSTLNARMRKLHIRRPKPHRFAQVM